ncbi:NAD(P)-binding protein [Amniculicola lignicola CBS 123094]|uniref:NAD(P)-binding protein n=1 Tax=Amniculicola lignicola CBS 123094 TaxID=1392246 RepID=A0A6A5WZE7_9PLEO|nr:NAD(P)-binding protein [Amniculicola lignicola CBS 123094]
MPGKAGTVLLTGANGFVASHILYGLIDRDYHVIATVRSEKKGQEIIDLHPAWKENITFVYIPDLLAEGAYDKAFEQGNLDYIIHNASPANFKAKDLHKDLVEPAVGGTTGLIAAAHKNGGSSLKRFVLLGSAVAVLDQNEDLAAPPGKPYTEANWNPVTEEEAIKDHDIIKAYNVSKVRAERAAWEFLEKNKPSFDLTVVNPDIIIGPLEQPLASAKSVNDTNVMAVYQFLNGQTKDIEGVYFPYWHYVDVRDVALAHILALTTPAASGKRIILVSGRISPQISVNTIRRHFPELEDRLAKSSDPNAVLPTGIQPTDWDTSRSKEIFGPEFKYRQSEESIVDTVKSLLAWEKKWEKSAA